MRNQRMTFRKTGEEKKVKKFSIKMQKKLVVLFLAVLLAFVALSIRLIMINKEKGKTIKSRFCRSKIMSAPFCLLKEATSWMHREASWHTVKKCIIW